MEWYKYVYDILNIEYEKFMAQKCYCLQYVGVRIGLSLWRSVTEYGCLEWV